MAKGKFIALAAGAMMAAAAGAFAAPGAEPAGDETFEGSFSCLRPSSSSDRSPILCQSQINPGLPVLDLTIFWQDVGAAGRRRIERIEIRRSGEAELLQTIAGIDSPVPDEAENAGLEMLDLNFDGFLDLRVMRAAPAGTNVLYRNWLWSAEDRIFAASPALDEIASPEFNAEDQEIVSRWRSGATRGTDVYSYEGAVPVLIHRETDAEDAHGACVRTFHDRIDDELKKTGTGACEAE